MRICVCASLTFFYKRHPRAQKNAICGMTVLGAMRPRNLPYLSPQRFRPTFGTVARTTLRKITR